MAAVSPAGPDPIITTVCIAIDCITAKEAEGRTLLWLHSKRQIEGILRKTNSLSQGAKVFKKSADVPRKTLSMLRSIEYVVCTKSFHRERHLDTNSSESLGSR